MPKGDWHRVDRYHIKHNTADATIAIYSDGVMLFIGDEPTGDFMKKTSEAIKYYDENITK